MRRWTTNREAKTIPAKLQHNVHEVGVLEVAEELHQVRVRHPLMKPGEHRVESLFNNSFSKPDLLMTLGQERFGHNLSRSHLKRRASDSLEQDQFLVRKGAGAFHSAGQSKEG